MFMKSKRKCILSIIILLSVQALLYFLVKFVQGDAHMIGSSFDEWFPFCKYFVFVYDSWYPFLIFVWYRLYMSDYDCYKRFFVASVLSMIIADFIFILYPSTIERAIFDVNDISSYLLSITYMFDTPVNCLPSMHCMFCFTSMYGALSSKFKTFDKVFICLYFVLIILSTMFIKQHVLYDVILAFVISFICYFVSKFRVFDKLKEYL